MGKRFLLNQSRSMRLPAKQQGNSRESHIYREICRIATANEDEIRRQFPRVLRRVAGLQP